MRPALLTLSASCALVGLSAAGPALAHDGAHGAPPPMPSWGGEAHGSFGMDPGAREAWLDECRARLSRGGSRIEGALIGGAVGGLAGNRIPGRGNRTIGTVAGAAVGAVAGAAIDGAVSDDRDARDECEVYLDDYYAQASSGYGYQHGYQPHAAYSAYGYGYGYGAPGYGAGCCQQPMMMVPIVRVARSEPRCTETVEYVDEYVDVEPAYVAPRARPAPAPARAKPVRVAPAKPVQIKPDKRVRIK